MSAPNFQAKPNEGQANNSESIRASAYRHIIAFNDYVEQVEKTYGDLKILRMFELIEKARELAEHYAWASYFDTPDSLKWSERGKDGYQRHRIMVYPNGLPFEPIMEELDRSTRSDVMGGGREDMFWRDLLAKIPRGQEGMEKS
jgi:hypothetical protein